MIDSGKRKPRSIIDKRGLLSYHTMCDMFRKTILHRNVREGKMKILFSFYMREVLRKGGMHEVHTK